MLWKYPNTNEIKIITGIRIILILLNYTNTHFFLIYKHCSFLTRKEHKLKNLQNKFIYFAADYWGT